MAQAHRQALFFLGTIHGGHLLSDCYHLGYLKAVLLHIRPELLMLEIRPEALAEGRFADGPLEMVYLLDIATELDIPVQGIDWHLDDEPPPISSEQRQSVKADLGKLKSPPGHHWPLSYQQCNSMRHLRHRQAMHQIHVKHLGDDVHGHWQRRNQMMSRHISRALEQSQAATAMVAVGVDHVADLWDSFAADDNYHCRLAGSIREKPSQSKAAPRQIQHWRRGVAEMGEALLQTAPDSLIHRKLSQKITAWQRAIRCAGLAGIQFIEPN